MAVSMTADTFTKPVFSEKSNPELREEDFTRRRYFYLYFPSGENNSFISEQVV